MFRLFRLFSVLLLTLTVIAWLRSYHFAEGIEFAAPGGSVLLASHPGRVRVFSPSPASPPTAYAVDMSSAPRERASSEVVSQSGVDVVPGAIFSRGIVWGSNGWLHFVEIPFWELTMVAALFPAADFLGRVLKRRRLRARSLCWICEYDLRGISDRCPECGTSVVPLPMRRRWTARLLVGAGIVCILFAGRWLTSHDFRSTRWHNMDFATLGGFDFDQEHGKLAGIPIPIRELDGRRIAIDGYMIPMDQSPNITEFFLVPELFGSGRRGPPPIQKAIVMRFANGQTSAYFPEIIRVSGVLRVRVVLDDGYIVSIFDMTVDRIQPVKYW